MGETVAVLLMMMVVLLMLMVVVVLMMMVVVLLMLMFVVMVMLCAHAMVVLLMLYANASTFIDMPPAAANHLLCATHTRQYDIGFVVRGKSVTFGCEVAEDAMQHPLPPGVTCDV